MRSEAACDADAQDLVAGTVKRVDARRVRQPIDERGIEVRRKQRTRQQFGNDIAESLASFLALDRKPARGKRLRVGKRAVSLGGGNTVTIDQRVEIVHNVFRIELP